MSSPELEIPETAEQAALACYLGTVVAIGNCMADVCPAVGAMYRDRLLKLPRRLGFDATSSALQQSREAVETDLLEYARTASAWINAGSSHAKLLLDHLRATEETMVAAADLQLAFLDDLAEHIGTSAEVDDEAQIRVSFLRYASGLRSYAQRARTEKLATIDDLQRRREEIESWLAEAKSSDFTDADTGLLNRSAAARRIETQIHKGQPFCVIVVESIDESNMKELADRVAAVIRPYDVVFRWSQNQLITIFEATETAIAARVRQIAGWLGDDATPRHVVSVVEYQNEESALGLMQRLSNSSQLQLQR